MKRLFATLVLAVLVAGGIDPAVAAPAAAREKTILIAVTNKGFEPAMIRLKAGEPVKLLVTRKTERTCAKDIVLKDYGVSKPLPLNKQVEVRFTPRGPGSVRYACAMDMITGSIVVE